ncbi:MAG: hypothetical protein MZW92_80085 [Comamonadaceae bacterium]|nr:hypothetical protein [Comamonadaceae bacterium]
MKQPTMDLLGADPLLTLLAAVVVVVAVIIAGNEIYFWRLRRRHDLPVRPRSKAGD